MHVSVCLRVCLWVHMWEGLMLWLPISFPIWIGVVSPYRRGTEYGDSLCFRGGKSEWGFSLALWKWISVCLWHVIKVKESFFKCRFPSIWPFKTREKWGGGGILHSRPLWSQFTFVFLQRSRVNIIPIQSMTKISSYKESAAEPEGRGSPEGIAHIWYICLEMANSSCFLYEMQGVVLSSEVQAPEALWKLQKGKNRLIFYLFYEP